jgi:hypothetical protein
VCFFVFSSAGDLGVASVDLVLEQLKKAAEEPSEVTELIES